MKEFLRKIFELKNIRIAFLVVLVRGFSALFPLYTVNQAPTLFTFFELSLAGSLVLRSYTSLGLTGTYPFYILKMNQLYIKQYYLIVPLVLLCANIVSLSLFSITTTYLISLLSLLSLQSLYSIHYKSIDKGHLSIIFDSLHVIIFSISFFIYPSKIFLTIFTLVTFIVLFFISVKVLEIKFYPFSFSDLYQMISRGIIILIISSSFTTIVNLGRLDYFKILDDNQILDYLVGFRICSIVLVFYQIFNYSFFRKLFMASNKGFDFMIIYSTTISYSLCVFVFLIWNFCFNNNMFSSFISRDFDLKEVFYFSTFIHLWVYSSLMETFMHRNSDSKKIIYVMPALILLILIYAKQFGASVDFTNYHIITMCLITSPILIYYLRENKLFPSIKIYLGVLLIYLCINTLL